MVSRMEGGGGVEGGGEVFEVRRGGRGGVLEGSVWRGLGATGKRGRRGARGGV